MKKLIATALLSLAVSPAFAGNIQETVASHRITDAQSVTAPAEFDYSPLYRQVNGDWMRAIDRQEARINTMTRFSYSPLYRRVTGTMG